MSRHVCENNSFELTSYYGGDKQGRCFQITSNTGYIQMTEKEAVELSISIINEIIEKMKSVSIEYEKKEKWISDIAKSVTSINLLPLETFYGIEKKDGGK